MYRAGTIEFPNLGRYDHLLLSDTNRVCDAYILHIDCKSTFFFLITIYVEAKIRIILDSAISFSSSACSVRKKYTGMDFAHREVC